MPRKKDEIKQVADAILQDQGIYKPRGYISRIEGKIREMIEEASPEERREIAVIMKAPKAVWKKLQAFSRAQDRKQDKKMGISRDIFADVTAAEIAEEFHAASQQFERGKTPRHDADRAYDGGGKIRPRTSLSYDGPSSK